MESSSFLGSSKRAKAPGNQVVHCLVDGCNADLSLCRDYHRRHKVCEIHSKTAKVSIGGREQRFCQQCSRFHSLVEFDEGKRSCRKRLDGHNRRRRKPQPIDRNSGLDFPNQQVTPGTSLLSFTSPQILPSAVVGFSWAGVVKTENEIKMPYNNNQQQQVNYIEIPNSFPKCTPHNQFCQPILDPNTAPGSSSNYCNLKILTDGLNQVVDSDRALSLLSSATQVTRELGLNRLVQSEPLHIHHSINYGGLGQLNELGQESKPVISSADLHGSNSSILHSPEMFQHGPEGSSTSGPHQTLTFMWE